MQAGAECGVQRAGRVGRCMRRRGQAVLCALPRQALSRPQPPQSSAHPIAVLPATETATACGAGSPAGTGASAGRRRGAARRARMERGVLRLVTDCRPGQWNGRVQGKRAGGREGCYVKSRNAARRSDGECHAVPSKPWRHRACPRHLRPNRTWRLRMSFSMVGRHCLRSGRWRAGRQVESGERCWLPDVGVLSLLECRGSEEWVDDVGERLTAV